MTMVQCTVYQWYVYYYYTMLVLYYQGDHVDQSMDQLR